MGANNKPFFSVNNLTHSFGGLTAVSGFDLTVEPESVWGIIGPNGAGKTTIFNLITGVYKADEGSVALWGEELVGLKSHRIVGRGIARTFQNIRLFKSMSVIDNIRTGAYGRLRYPWYSCLLRSGRFRSAENQVRQECCAILEKFGLADRRHQPAASLPYGVQRKIELARALISRPVLLLLDEPGAGMNPAELDALADLVLWVRQEFKVAILIIEHRMPLVMKVCQQVRVLNFGRTLFTGKPGDLRGDAAVVRAYLG
ncbi:MAG: ABC transporter ATP-binding protein [Chitinivibrionales bacterium]|nr:ABC transporter ATP-binding protein [Chitinivibrionales bacterium]